MKMVSFLGISDDTVVKQGTEFKRSHFVEVPIPANRAQGLEDFVYLYSDLPLLETRLAIKSYEGGELVFKQKTAYEIGVRLVGSEMCIRDRSIPECPSESNSDPHEF